MAKKSPSHSKVAIFFGGMSFIPLLGIVFGVIAILIGAFRKDKTAIFLGVGGICFTVGLYSFLRNKLEDVEDPDKPKLTQLILNDSAMKIYGLKQVSGTFPGSLSEIEETAHVLNMDAWGQQLQYNINGDTVVLKSAGPDGQFGTLDDMENVSR